MIYPLNVNLGFNIANKKKITEIFLIDIKTSRRLCFEA